MPLPSCVVTARCYQQDGTPDPGARVTARLNRPEVYEGYVIPEEVTAIADGSGVAVLTLFRNALGANSSHYNVRLEGTSGAVARVTAVVPDLATADLEDIATYPIVPARPDATETVALAADYAAAAAAGVDSWLPDYAAVRAYTGTARNVFVTGYLVTSSPAAYAGWFVRDDSDTTSADNGGTILVAANGKRWKRVFSGPLDVRWFGAKGDGVTDDAPAIQACIDAHGIFGGGVFVPKTTIRYRIASRLVAKTHLVIEGEGAHDNPGRIGSTTYAFPTYYTGSVMYVDAAQGGLIAYDANDLTIAQFNAEPDPAQKFEFSGSRKSVMRNLMWLNANLGAGDDVGAHGIEVRSIWHFDNVQCLGFQGDGFRTDATADAGTTNPYGNASQTSFVNCKARFNSGNGFYTNGRDANIINFIGCDAANNGRWGFKDDGFLGNNYLGCHAATNNKKYAQFGAGQGADADQYVGSYYASSGVAPHKYIGCYTESGGGNEARLAALCEVNGGNLASVGTNVGSRNHAPDADYLVALAGTSNTAKGWNSYNRIGAKIVRGGLGANPAKRGKVASWFGSTDDSANAEAFKLEYEFNETGAWEWVYANSASARIMQLLNGLHANNIASLANAYALGLPNGLYMGVAATAPRLLPARTTVPTTGTYRAGDLVPNSAPAVDGIDYWRRLTSGSTHVVGVDWETIHAQSVANVVDYTAFRASTSGARIFRVTGYQAAAAPLGIGGEFVYDPADTTTADNGGTVIMRADGRRYKRIYDGAVNVKWFGAKGDGVTNDTAAIQSAINWAKSFSATATEVTLVFPAGDYRVTTLSLAGASRVTLQAWGSVLISGTSVGGVAVLNIDGAGVTQTTKLNIVGNFTIGIAAGGSYQYGIKINYLTNSRWPSFVTVTGAFSVNPIYADLFWGNYLALYAVSTSGTAIASIKTGSNNVNNNEFYCRTVGSSDMTVASIGMELTGSGNSVRGDFSTSQIGLKVNAARGTVIGPIYTEITKYPVQLAGIAKATEFHGGEVEVGTNGSLDFGSSENTVIHALRVKGIAGGSNRTAIDQGASCYGLKSEGLSIDSATIDNAYAGTWRGDGGHAKSFNVGACQWMAWPATQVPAGHVNTLDDYEKGTGNLSLTCNTPGDMAVAAYAQRAYSYTKVGRDVTVHFDIVIAAGQFTHATASGAMRITGIPFPAGTTGARGSIDFAGITKASYSNFTVHVDPSGTYFEIYASGSGQPISTVKAADMPTGGAVELHGSITYQAAN